MNFEENFRIIDDFPNYRVDRKGRVINKNNHELKQVANRNGYSMVKLCRNGYEKNCSTHRLVAEAFIPNPHNKQTVNHIDGDKSNNDVTNLEWVTYSENEKHAYQHKLKKSYLTDEDRKNGAVISSEKRRRPVRVLETDTVYPSITACAKDLGCEHSGIWRCCKGLANQHHGYHFEFEERGVRYGL